MLLLNPHRIVERCILNSACNFIFLGERVRERGKEDETRHRLKRERCRHAEDISGFLMVSGHIGILGFAWQVLRSHSLTSGSGP